MALVVETGSGSATADAYDTLALIETYLTSMGGPSATWTALATDAIKETHIRKATRYLDAQYGPLWRGRQNTDTQALDWPRSGAYDDDDYLIANDSVPVEVRRSLAYLSDASSIGELIPDQASPGTIKSKRVKAGEVEQDIEYMSGLEQEKFYRLVDALLAPLLEGANSLARA